MLRSLFAFRDLRLVPQKHQLTSLLLSRSQDFVRLPPGASVAAGFLLQSHAHGQARSCRQVHGRLWRGARRVAGASVKRSPRSSVPGSTEWAEVSREVSRELLSSIASSASY